MKPPLALVTSAGSLPIDVDMPLLLAACQTVGLQAQVCDWEDPQVNWGRFEAAVLRSPWNYVDCVARLPGLVRPGGAAHAVVQSAAGVALVAGQALSGDLAAAGVPVVPTEFVAPQVGEAASLAVLDAFMARHPASGEVVIKPTVGAYSKDVRRFPRAAQAQAHHYLRSLQSRGAHVMLQPYLAAIDRDGETNLAFFDGHYSHAIRKGAMLMSDGTVHVPTQDLRQARQADAQEQAVARLALQAAARHLQLEQPLLYARVDLIRDGSGQPRVLELELCEPSLNLPFADGSALRFAQAIARRLGA